MKTYVLNELKQLTIITGNSFSGKTDLLNEISKETCEYSKFINFNTEVDFKVTEELKHWFKFVFDIDFVQPAKYSYVLRILSAGLNCKEGELLIIENPEIGLHPKAISKMGKFFTFLANNGIKVLIETNSTDIVNSICYEVLRKNINNCDVVFYNKTRDNIDKININENGKFIDDNKKLVRYPSGFFDANTDEVWALL
ncbi:AAA family ATPase [Campylobacter hyointestinalis]|uniref:AAA family ATPase n=1 Tax=Campylobacter hyointestinalis TaxID=198 RepID=A0A562XKD2_CAMHY|nr:AAA family ATPase [Campylobacter hyointestinalis]TWO22591.1 AAA family ATPase [Campylobacter hyointestinalis]